VSRRHHGSGVGGFCGTLGVPLRRVTLPPTLAGMVQYWQDASPIFVLAEPWCAAFNASVEMPLVLVLEAVRKAGPASEPAVTRYG
jgi:hypothetical protein